MHATTGRPLLPGEPGAPGPGRRAIVLTRTLPLGPGRLWTYLATPDGLEEWIGTYEGDPASGQVRFRMTAEGPEADWTPLHINVCRPEALLDVAFAIGDDRWDIGLSLDGDDDGTELHFSHCSDDVAGLAEVGAGWEFHLDRLDAVTSGAPVEDLDFGDYDVLVAAYDRLLDGMTVR